MYGQQLSHNEASSLPANRIIPIYIDIGDGRKDTISAYTHSDPLNLAKAFCQKHRLDQEDYRKIVYFVSNTLQNEIRKENNEIMAAEKAKGCNHDKQMAQKQWMESRQSKPDKLKQNKYLMSQVRSRQSDVAITRSKMSNARSLKDERGISRSYGNLSTGTGVGSLNTFIYPQTNQSLQKFFKDESSFQQRIQYSYTPKPINPTEYTQKQRKSNLVKGRHSTQNFTKVEDELIYLGQVKKDNKLCYKYKSHQHSLSIENPSSFPFKPEINKHSRRLVQTRDGLIYENLYQQANERQDKKEEKIDQELEEIPFEPDLTLNQDRNEMVKGKFIQRQQDFIKRKEDRIEERKDEQEAETYDMFNPEICRKPKAYKEQKQSAKSSSMFNRLREIQDKLQSQRDQQDQEAQEACQMQFTSNNMQVWITRLKNRKYEEIFNLLDDDRDNQISHGKVNTKYLENQYPEIYDILQPLFAQMEQKQLKFNKKQFSEALEKTLKFYHRFEVNQWLKISKTREIVINSQKELTFRPSLNRSNSTKFDIVSRQRNFLNAKERKAGILQNLEKERELKMCTFHPKVNRPSSEIARIVAKQGKWKK